MDNETQDLIAGKMVISLTDNKYELVPDGEPLKVHISEVGTKTVPNKFKQLDSDPDEVTKLVIGFTLDEDIEGKGQTYTGWYTPSLNEKSKLRPVVQAFLGEIREFDPTELVGKSARMVLINKDKDGTVRQYPDSFLKPAADQKDVKVEKKKDTFVSADDIMDAKNVDEISAMFDAD